MLVKEEIITDKKTIAVTLNLFFIDQPKNLIKALSPSLTSRTINTNLESSFHIPQIIQKRVAEILLSIALHNATVRTASASNY